MFRSVPSVFLMLAALALASLSATNVFAAADCPQAAASTEHCAPSASAASSDAPANAAGISDAKPGFGWG